MPAAHDHEPDDAQIPIQAAAERSCTQLHTQDISIRSPLASAMYCCWRLLLLLLAAACCCLLLLLLAAACCCCCLLLLEAACCLLLLAAACCCLLLLSAAAPPPAPKLAEKESTTHFWSCFSVHKIAQNRSPIFIPEFLLSRSGAVARQRAFQTCPRRQAAHTVIAFSG